MKKSEGQNLHKDALIRINKLVVESQNCQSVTEFKTMCDQLIKLIKDVPQRQNTPYIIFLIDVYTHKLDSLNQSYGILEFIRNSEDKDTKIQYQIRVIYNKFRQRIYKDAYEHLKILSTLIKNNKKGLNIVANYFNRILHNDYCKEYFQANFIKSVFEENEGRTKKAAEILIKQYNKVSESSNIKSKEKDENIYFIVKRIEHISSRFSNSDIKGLIQKQQKFISDIEKSNKRIVKQYDQMIKFIEQIQEITKAKQQNSQNLYNHLTFQILAYFKLKKTINSLDKRKSQEKRILQQSLKTVNQKLIDPRQIQQKSIIFQNFVTNQIIILQNFASLIAKMKIDKKIKMIYPWKMLKTYYFNKNNDKTNLLSALGSMLKNKKEPVEMDEQFIGSIMTKIHQNSDGSESRYFYIKPKQLKNGKYRIYYVKNKNEKSSDDDYYSLKNVKRLEEGKQSSQLKRESSYNFEQDHCFSLILDDCTRSFYVPDKKDYRNWINIFKKLTNSDFVEGIVKSMLTQKVNGSKYQFT